MSDGILKSCGFFCNAQAENDLRAAKGELKKAVSLLKMDELRVRQRILRRLNYCDENGVIVQKVQCV